MAEATEHQLRAEQLLNDLLSDKDVGAKVRAKAREKFPDARVAHEDPVLVEERAARAALEERFVKLEAERAEEREERAKADVFEKLRSKVDGAARKMGLTDEGRDKMLERMKETGNTADPEAAAAWVARMNPPPPPPGPSWSPQNLDLFGSNKVDEQYAALHRDPVKFMDDQLGEFMRNPDKFVAETLGG